MSSKNIAIIGAGLVGSLLSVFLKKRGYEVTLYERRSDMRTNPQSAGRSINLALSDRGIRALETVGIMEEIRKVCIPMHGRQIHLADGTQTFQPYGNAGQFINSVSRGELNARLMDVAEATGVPIYFNHACHTIDWKTNTISFRQTENGETNTLQADIILATDGAFSAARLQHMLHHSRFDYQQSYIGYGYLELTIPAGENGGFLVEKNALHIWPRGHYMLIALPNTDGSFTCTLFFPFEGEASFKSIQTKEQADAFFKQHFADACTLMPDVAEQFFKHTPSALVTVKCFPWIREDQFALIGDAAHAMVPFFGQGMNCGFEDCTVLNTLLDQYEDDWSQVLPAFQTLRKPDGDAIAQLALNNFAEMRDKVADPRFLLQKKIEAAFSKKHPEKWIPAYSQVTFSPHIRYSEALRNSQRQQAIMDEVMQLPDIEMNWDSSAVEAFMLNKLS